MRAPWVSIVVTLLVLPGLGSCSKVVVSFDCPGLCTRLKSCVESLLDVTTCSERCLRRISMDEDLREQVDTCADCIDRGYACDELTSQCKSCRPAAEGIVRGFSAPVSDAGEQDAE